jgi:hypothetical protein
MIVAAAAGTSPLSKLIMWALNEPVSHFIIIDGKLVFHSNLLGVNISSLQAIQQTHKIVYQVTPPATTVQRQTVYNDVTDKVIGDAYDYRAFFYFCWRALLFKCFKTPLPVKVPWNTNSEFMSKFLCTEMGELLPPEWIKPLDPKELGIVSPYKLIQAVMANFPGQSQTF